MPDISEIWDNAAFIAAFAAGVVLVVLSLRIRRRWLRNLSLAICSLFTLLTTGLLFLIGCDMVQSNARIPGLVSPDHKHIAVVRWWLPGALGDDMVHNSIRRSFSPIATEVSVGAATAPDPKVEWLDDHRLLVTYFDKGKIEPCEPRRPQVDGIQVFCKD